MIMLQVAAIGIQGCFQEVFFPIQVIRYFNRAAIYFQCVSRGCVLLGKIDSVHAVVREKEHIHFFVKTNGIPKKEQRNKSESPF